MTDLWQILKIGICLYHPKLSTYSIYFNIFSCTTTFPWSYLLIIFIEELLKLHFQVRWLRSENFIHAKWLISALPFLSDHLIGVSFLNSTCLNLESTLIRHHHKAKILQFGVVYVHWIVTFAIGIIPHVYSTPAHAIILHFVKFRNIAVCEDGSTTILISIHFFNLRDVMDVGLIVIDVRIYFIVDRI